MKNEKNFILLGCLMLAIALGAVSLLLQSPPPAPMGVQQEPTPVSVVAQQEPAPVSVVAHPPVVLKLATYVGVQDIRYSDHFEKFAELVAAKSNGSLVVEVKGHAIPKVLGGWGDGINAVKAGVVDIAWIASVPTQAPCYESTYLYPAAIDLTRQVELDSAYARLTEAEFEKAGLRHIFSSNYSYDQEWWFSARGVDLRELDGLRVRSIGGKESALTRMIEYFGGVPIFKKPTDTFQEARAGLLEGVNMGVATFTERDIWPFMPHFIDADLFYGVLSYAMSQDRFDSLTPTQQSALLEAGREAEEYQKPRYEKWINEKVGEQVMKGSATARSLTRDERDSILAEFQPFWNDAVRDACGESAGAFIDLFASHSL